MSRIADSQSDPSRWNLLFTTAFLGLCLWRIATPSTPMFDETHYLPAARELLATGGWTNREHPLLGKELIALGIALLGDNAFGWRVFPALFGALALYAGMRAMWFANHSRFASLGFGMLLGTGFFLFIHARIAMLDVFMVAFFMLALWHCAAAVREPETGRWRLAIAGIALGLAMASKWNVVFLAMLPGLAFFCARLTAGRRRLVTSRRGVPVPGIALWEAALLLGALPLFAYWLTFLPAYFAPQDPLQPGGFIALHTEILRLQASVTQPHPYQSVWSDWVFNLRAIWYLYEPVDGAQRGVVLLGNPLTMLLGLPALGWAVWTGVVKRRWDALAITLMFAISLGMWPLADKPIQFYYHYFLPSCFLLAALALACDALWQRGRRKLALAPIIGSMGFFTFFYPILSAWPLASEYSFLTWAWIDGWR